ncbi:MAG: hypothetical protein LBK76_09955, partial [Verrucomicrobiales bacterium]|nr:hypothetical protein [Verrucomicrobiales bacterium]
MPTNLITATRRLLRAAVNAHGQTVKQWAALLAVICGLTFNAQAANKRVTATGTTFDSDATYDSAWSNVIIYVGGAAGGVVYSGTNITTISASTWIGMAIVNSGTVELSTGTLDNRNSPNFALSVVHNSYFSGTNVTLLGNGVVVDVGRGQPFGSQLHLTDSRIESFGANSLGALSLYYENSKAYLDHVTIITESGRGIYSYGSGGVTGNRVIINSGGWGIQMDTPSIYTAYDLTDSVINAKDAAIVSYSSNGNLGTISIHGGSVTATEGVLVSVSGTNHNLTVNFTDGAVLAGQGLLDNHEINGNVVINLDQVDSGSAGGITVSDTNAARTEVNVNGGTGINGDVTNSGSGALTVNLDHSSLTGDAANLGDGVLVITLDNHSTGSGGYNGGNLITGGDSAWTFNKNSHGHYGENNGVWNIGDYDVIFDNLTHSGTLNISVNNDTGEGGSIVVTGTADGDGTVHIDTTGDGQADPNQVLPGIVSGEGTEHW